MGYNRDAILEFLSSTPKGLYDSEKRWSYEVIDRYLREHPDDTEVRDLLLTHALKTPVTAGSGEAMLSAALAHHPSPEARDRLLERALKSVYRNILEWGVKKLHALPPHERNPDLVKLLAHRADAATHPAVDALMRDTLAPDDYKAFRLVADGLASRSHRGRIPQDELWRALLRLERLWGSSVLIPYIVQTLDSYGTASESDYSLVRRVAERYWNATGRDLLRAIADTKLSEWKRWGINHLGRFDFWQHAVVGVAMEDADAAFDHLLHDILGDQNRFKELFGAGDLETNYYRFVQLLCVPLSVASPAQLERMRDDIHAFAARLPEWITDDIVLAERFLDTRSFEPWYSAPDAVAVNPVYALRPLVRAVFHALEEKHGETLRRDYEHQNRLVYTVLGLLPTLAIDSAEDIPQAQKMFEMMENEDVIEWGQEARAMETARTLLETAFAWDDLNAAAWNARVRASNELRAFLETTSPTTHALWELAMAGMPGAPSRESVYESVLNRLFPPNARLEDVDRNLREILDFLKSLPRNRSNPEWEVMRFTRAVRERFAPAVYEKFLRGIRDGDSWDSDLNFLAHLIGALHGETDTERFLPLLIMPSELLTANPRVVNEKLRSLQTMQLWELESALKRKLCS
jgi:hypothetical protein